MEEMSKALKEIHDAIGEAERPRGSTAADLMAEHDAVAQEGTAANRLRAAAALIANDAILFMVGEMQDRALAMAKATAAFCDLVEEESDLEKRWSDGQE